MTANRNPSRRAKDQTAISISLPKRLRAEIDARARSLHISRSEYLIRLAAADVKRGGPMVLQPDPPAAP